MCFGEGCVFVFGENERPYLYLLNISHLFFQNLFFLLSFSLVELKKGDSDVETSKFCCVPIDVFL